MTEPRDDEERDKEKEKIEGPKEICGFMAAMEYGVAQKVNLFATREEVVEKIQAFRSSGVNTMIEFKTANPDTQETFLIDPKRILLSIITKEFIIGGNVVPISQVTGQAPSNYRH